MYCCGRCGCLRRRLQNAQRTSPSAVQPGQSLAISLQVDLHASQVTGQLRIMNSGFSLHSPAAPHPGHSSFRSLHSGVQRPQLVGQMRSIASGLASHSPCMAHAPHDASVSLHVCVHVPHESGQTSAMYFCEGVSKGIGV